MAKKKRQTVDNGERRGVRRGVYLLPNLFTTAAMFAGFFAVVAAMDGNFQSAAIAIFIAMVLDGLDGRVARMTQTESDFGKEFDSLSDLVSFGLAPALVIYQWGLAWLSDYPWVWGKLGWLVTFFYAVAAALRLARFNTRTAVQDKRFFQGLPSPAAAGFVAGSVWLVTDVAFLGREMIVPVYLIAAASGALMVSNVSYYSFKDLNLQGRVPFTYILLIPLVFILIALSPAKVLFTIFALYALSGPTLAMWRWRRRVLRRAESD